MTDFHTEYFAKHAPFVQTICEPLFDCLPISYFTYILKYNTGKLFCITSSALWAPFYFAKKYPLLSTSKSELRQWQSIMPDSAQADAANYFNLHNGLVIEKNHGDHIEIVEFASQRPEDIPLELYCNYGEILSQFIFYFKEQAQKLIARTDKETIYLRALLNTIYKTQKTNPTAQRLKRS